MGEHADVTGWRVTMILTYDELSNMNKVVLRHHARNLMISMEEAARCDHAQLIKMILDAQDNGLEILTHAELVQRIEEEITNTKTPRMKGLLIMAHEKIRYLHKHMEMLGKESLSKSIAEKARDQAFLKMRSELETLRSKVKTMHGKKNYIHHCNNCSHRPVCHIFKELTALVMGMDWGNGICTNNLDDATYITGKIAEVCEEFDPKKKP